MPVTLVEIHVAFSTSFPAQKTTPHYYLARTQIQQHKRVREFSATNFTRHIP